MYVHLDFCSALLNFSTYPMLLLFAIYVHTYFQNAPSFYPSILTTAVSSSHQEKPRLKLEASGLSYFACSFISTSLVFSPLPAYSSFQAGHCLISPWWLETTPQAQVLGCRTREGSLLIYSHPPPYRLGKVETCLVQSMFIVDQRCESLPYPVYSISLSGPVNGYWYSFLQLEVPSEHPSTSLAGNLLPSW